METGVSYISLFIYGDGWEEEEDIFTKDDAELEYYKSPKCIEDKLKVSGIEHVNVEIKENLTLEELKKVISVREFIKLFPEVGELIDNHFLS